MTTLVIVHWNRPQECLSTIDAFRGQGVPLNVVVVDNGSKPEARTALESSAQDVHFVWLPENIGWGPALNVGLRHWMVHHEGEWVIVAPHDALPHPHCLEHIFSELATRPRAGIACAEYGLPIYPAYDCFRGASTAEHPRGSGWEDVCFPNGTLMVFRRAMLAEIGFFDEHYFAYGEEAEFAFRARRAGWKVGHVWGAVVSNPIRAASSQLTWYLLTRNSVLNVYQISGVISAFARTLAALGGMMRLILDPRRIPEGDSVRLRLRAVKDFWIGRLGPPPTDLLPTK